ncbi:MAG: hypothetical protein JSV22_09680 [Bacteroidales bacterium]|nr:MAG: hypothetical protein JSV22_09680 [Bacteroidales bacterium]
MYWLILILLTSARIYLHPVHVSITNIDINSELNTTEISCQFFADDFQSIVQYKQNTELVLVRNKELSQSNINAINDYIYSAFEIKINNKEKISLDFKSKKQDEALIWLYYEGKIPINNITSITLVNELMLDLYEDQTNLVIVNIDGQQKGYTFSYRKRVFNIKLK